MIAVAFDGQAGALQDLRLRCIAVNRSDALSEQTIHRLVVELDHRRLDAGGANLLMSTLPIFLIIGLMGFKHGAFFKNFMTKGEPFAMFATCTMIWSGIAIAVKVAAAELRGETRPEPPPPGP